jgi:hypothetical protein
MPKKQTAPASTPAVDLDKRGAAYSAGKLDVRYVVALAKRCNIPIQHLISGSWADFAFAVIREYVPAFMVARPSGSRKKPHQERGIAWPHAHEARLVQLVKHFQNENIRLGLARTRPEAFKKVAKHSNGYHWKYKDLKKPGAFAQEWKKIPADVKENPSRFLPPPQLRYRGGVVPIEIVQPEFERLQRVLPPVPPT